MKKYLSTIIISLLTLAVTIIIGMEFRSNHRPEIIVRGPGVTEVRWLSDWFPGLRGSPGDTEVFILRGTEPGETMLILGGVHTSEPTGFMSAVVLIENMIVDTGTVFIIPRANASAFTHTTPQEGHPARYTIELPDGSLREFRFGSRLTNPVHQWPDPDLYIHMSGVPVAGPESRNLNRVFPGRPDGNLTERVAYGITTLIVQENILITVDLHEASPEFPTNNAIVVHERAGEMGALLVMDLQDNEGIDKRFERSPVGLRGLTHRELGDYTNTYMFLFETPNVSQGRIRGRTDAALVLTGDCIMYIRAVASGFSVFCGCRDVKLPHPIEQRVGRHLAGIYWLLNVLNWDFDQYGNIEARGIPRFQELQARGLGTFLIPVRLPL